MIPYRTAISAVFLSFAEPHGSFDLNPPNLIKPIHLALQILYSVSKQPFKSTADFSLIRVCQAFKST